jgi:hypothetical protein
VLVVAEENEKVFSRLLRQEKDEASLPIGFRRGSLNAFILRFAGVWRFFIFRRPPENLPAPRWSLNRQPFVEDLSFAINE